jgi:hypothetical protein
VGCHAGRIARNSFTTMSGNAVQCKGGSEDIEIRANHFIDAGERGINLGGSTGDEFFRPPLSTSEPNVEARNIRAVANLFEGAVAALAFVGCVDCLAANNTIVDPTNWVFRILQEKTSSATHTFLETQNGRFVNNLVYFARGELSTTVNVGPNTQGESFEFANNLWFAHDDPASSGPTDLPAVESGAIVGQDPALGDPGSGDYSIDASSPAAGAGVQVAELGGDYAGNCFGSPPSIGALEIE